MASPFKFLKAWSLRKDCRNLIDSVWKQNIIGCHMFVLSKKLQLLKGELRRWNQSSFGNISDNVKKEEERLCSVQHQIQLDGVIDSKDIADCVMAYFKKIFSTNSVLLQDMKMLE